VMFGATSEVRMKLPCSGTRHHGKRCH